MSIDISVVVPVRDGASSLPPLLAALNSQAFARDRFEVIVVDNASRDGSARVAAEAGALVLHEPVPNRCLARNRGVRAASGELLAFIDADCVPDAGWLGAMWNCRGRAPLVAGPVRITTDAPPNAIERFEALWRFAQEYWVREGWAVTANLCVRREAFDAIDGFDPAYRHYAEDADFCLRAGRADFPIGYCADAVVSHYAESRLRPMLRRAFFHGYGASQALRRIGFGHHAYRHPAPIFHTKGALALMGIDRNAIRADDRRAIGRLARMAYAARVAGSLWATVRFVR
jgi:GT2 family glycosyltransferase